MVRRGADAVAVAGYAAAVVSAGMLLFAVIAGFTWHKYHADYAVYANMIWNSAHGFPFRYFMDLNYLQVHLSYSLLLLAPFFRLWDNPFLLCAIQWVSLVIGAALLLAAARRHRLPHSITAAIIFFTVSYRFTQNVQVHAFHGVALYFLLVPLLYYALSFHKKVAAIPIIIILGLREDAGLVILPILFYFAVKDRWAAGYVLAALAGLYCLAAVFLIYPWINGVTILDHRRLELAAAIGDGGLPGSFHSRLEGLMFLAIPMLALASRRIPIALFFVCAALGQNLLSGWRNQYVLETHYSAAVMAFLAIGLLETAVRLRHETARRKETDGRFALRAVALIALTLIVHARSGIIWGSPHPDRRLTRINDQGLSTIKVARAVPPQGILLCTGDVEEFFAHRKDLLVQKRRESATKNFDMVFGTSDKMSELMGGRVRELVESGAFGIRLFDGYNILLERGADPSRNKLLLEMK